MEFEFDLAKNLTLKQERGIGFEEIIALISDGHLLEVVEHHNKGKYPKQLIYLVDVEGMVYLVPFVQTDAKIFLKTIYPSRKATKNYLKSKGGGGAHD